MSKLSKKVSQLTKEEKKALAAKLLKKKKLKQQQEKKRQAQQQSFPLSFAQQRLWLLDQLDPGNYAYNIPGAVQLKGALDVAVLEKALTEITNRHEALRTVFASNDGDPKQVVLPEKPFLIEISKLPDEAQQNQNTLIQQVIAKESQRTFDLEKGPLVRASLYEIAPQYFVLFFCMHHIISDGWSMGVFVQELIHLYQAFAKNEKSLLPTLPIQYVDFSVWQRQWLQGEVQQKQLKYWEQQLADPAVLELPLDKTRPATQTMHGSTISFYLSEEVSGRIKDICQQKGITPFMLLLAGYAILLAKQCGQEDICIGSPIAGRNRQETEGLIGFFVNTLVFRADVSGNPSFNTLLEKIREMALDAYAHQDLPFEQLVEVVSPQRDMSHTPIFQTLFVLQNTPAAKVDIADVELQALEIDNKTAKFDLSLNMVEQENGFAGVFEYNTDLFESKTIDAVCQRFSKLLECATDKPETKLSDLALLSREEIHCLLNEWNEVNFTDNTQNALHELFEQQVLETPDGVAVSYQKNSLTYQSLNQKSNQLAHHLRSCNVTANSLVGLCIERSIDMVVAIFGILKAGGAYVPLDPGYPTERLNFMLEDINSPVLITCGEATKHLQIPDATTVIKMDDDLHTIAQQSTENPELMTQSEDTAYAIFTSGSTGKPKGVLVPHRAIINHMRWMSSTFPMSQTHKVLQKTPFSFDASVWEFYASLFNGGELVMAEPGGHQDPDYLIKTINEKQITDLQTVPTLLQMLLDSDSVSSINSLQRIYCGGEALSPHLVEEAQQKLSVKVINFYGPTECTIDAIYFECEPEVTYRNIPIGKPVTNSQCYVLDEYLKLVPPGAAGELHITGVGVAKGYHNRPEMTQKVFIENPFATGQQNKVLYKTGDRVRYLSDGNIEYLGRMDHQIKLRGFRIELGEIETLLKRHAQVQECLVVVREDTPGNQRLTAYIAAHNEAEVDVAVLRAYLKEKLADYMVPAAFIVMPELPLLPNGKVDRKALPVPDGATLTSMNEFVAARNPTEEIVADIWSKLLGVNRVGVHDNFFEMGGHSLLATQVISHVRKQLKVEVSLRMLFEAPTIDEFAERIERARIENSGMVAPEMKKVSRDQSLPLSFAQERLWFLDQLDANNPIFNIPSAIRLKGELNVEAFDQAVNKVVARHESLRTTFVEEAGKPVQKIVPQVFLPLLIMDAESEDQIYDLALIESKKPFDLKQGPLARVTLIRIASNDHVLLLTLHHIISDGWSSGILVKETAAFYNGIIENQPVRLPELAIQYADYAHWQRNWLQGEVLDQQFNYWKNKLSDCPDLLKLPTDRPRPATQTFNGAHLHFTLPMTLVEPLNQHCRQQNITLFMMLLACYQLLLSRYSGQQDICVGIPIAGRNREETEALIGFFVNGLVMRSDLSGNPSFTELLSQVKETTLAAYAHQDLSFELLVEAIQPERNLSYAPIAQVAFALQNAPFSKLNLPGLTIEPIDYENGSAKYDLTLIMMETQNGLMGSFEYNTDLFDVETIEKISLNFQQLITDISKNSDKKLNAISLISRQQLIELLNQNESQVESILPLTATQRDLYLESLLHPDTLQNSLGLAVEIEPLNYSLFEKAVQLYTDSQTVLRTKIVGCHQPYADVAYQCVMKPQLIKLPVINAENESTEWVKNKAEQLITRTYQIHDDQLINPTLIKLSDEKVLFVLAVHHMMMDGVSTTEYLFQVTSIYENLRNNESAEIKRPSYQDYIEQCRQDFDDIEIQTFWKKKFENVEALDYPATLNNQPSLVTKSSMIDAEHWKEIRKFCRSQRVTPALYFKALYGILLNTYCRPDSDFSIFEFQAGRPKGFATAMGCFYQQIPFVFEKDCYQQDMLFADYLKVIRNAQKSLGSNKNISIFLQSQLLATGRIKFLYNFYHFPAEIEVLGKTQAIWQYNPPVAENEIQLIVKLIDDQTQLNLLYNNQQFTDYDFIGRLLHISQQIVGGTESIQSLKWLDQQENNLITNKWNNTQTALPPVSNIHSMFEQQVEKTPDAIAGICGEQQISYQQLNDQANQLANHLISLGIQSNQCVGLCLNRSLNMLISVLAVLKAGGAYLPLDSQYPKGRLEFMLDDSKASILITESSLNGVFSDCQQTLINIDKDQSSISENSTTKPDVDVISDNTAYVIYTSGTTGKPKGAALKHIGEINLLQWYCREFGFNENDKTLLISAFGFDLTQKNLFALLTVGGCVVIPEMTQYDDQLIIHEINKQQITLLNCAPSAFYPLVESSSHEEKPWQHLASLRCVFLGGESIAMNKLIAWQQSNVCDAMIVNTYGPTECTDIAAFYKVSEAEKFVSQSIPIGRPNDNVQLFVLDHQQKVLPIGLVGELCVAGTGVGLGYLNQPELTNDKFTDHPYGEGKLYHTGDLVRYLEDGNIDYIGRIDHQVKLRGLRIELGEIESVLSQQEAVNEVLVLVKNDVLVAYLISDQKQMELSNLRQALANDLPDYMIPSAFVVVDSWPLTPNGKIDRKALPEADTTGQQDYVAPRNDIERILCQQWSNLLDVKEVGATHNFFELGGHSLMATQAISSIRQQFSVELSVRALFESPTVGALAEQIEIIKRQGKQLMAPPMVVMSKDEALPLSFAQERLWFLDQLEPNDPIYNIPASVKLIGDLSVDALQQAIEDIIQRHETLRSQIIVVDGKPKQLIHASGVTQLVKIDLSNITEKEQSVQVNQLAMDESRKAFDLSLRELFRTTLISLNDKEYVLLLTLHHIISDGWSNALLIRELSAFYLARLNNNHAQLPNLPIQYADYAHWQRQWLQGEVIDALIGYWYNHLQGAPAFITLPTDRPRPAIQTFNGDHYNFRIAKDLSDELVSLSQQQGVTLFMMLMAVYQLLLSRYAGQDDISVGIPIAGRNRTEVEGLIGFFINGLILRTDLSGNPSFSDLLKRVREVTLDAYAHQDAPAEMVVEALSPERNLSYSPLAQVGFALQNIGLSGQLEIPGLRFEPIEQENKTSKYDMTLIMAESADGLMGSVEYNTDLFDESTIETMMRHFQHLLKTVVLQSESSLSTLAVFDRHELFQILNIGETEYEKILPLTSTQRDIYLESVLNPDTQFNSIGYAIEVNHKLDVDCWTKALQKITDHEPLLRTKIIASDLPYTDLAYQCVLKHKKISVKIIEMEGNTVDRGYLEDIVFRSYDMTKDDLVQYFLLKYSDDLWVLIMTCHHTMMDGLGGWEHWDRMHLLYAAELNKTEHELAEPAFEQFIGDSLKLTDNVDVINYWKQKSQNIEPLDFSVSSAWKGDINQQIITKQLTLPNEQWKKIRSFCRKNKSTPAVYFKALYGLLINGYCQPAANFQISEYLGNRRKQHNTALGCYYEQVPAVFDLSAMSNETSIKDYLASVRGFVKEVKGLQHLSILKQKQYLGQGRIQFAYNFITIASEYQFLGEDVQKIHHFTPPVAEGQVQFITKLVNDELQFFVHYYPETFTDFDFLQRFVTLNEQMLAESCEYLGELQLLSDNEKSHQVMTLNQNAVKQADVVAIQCLIEQQVEKTPDAIALQFQQEKLTYQQLNQRSNQLAHYLRNNEVGVGSKVGICLERSSELLVAVIAVLKSGAAYVPMDSSYPQGRLEYMVEDSTIPLLITHSSLEDKFDNADIKVVCIDKDQAEIEHCSTDNPEITNKPDDMAYVIYTSGTTGRPKGATVRHSGEINLLQWYTSEFNFAEVDKTLLISAFGFDLTQKNLFALLTVGGCVVIPDMSHYDADIIASNIEEHSITLLNCAPSAFYPMVDLANNDKANINSLHHVFLGGEPIQVNQLNQWLSSEACQCQIVNTYGPTECTDIAAFYRLTDPTEYLSKSMPIGQANSNVNLYIVNQQHQLIPEGLVGELCIGGVGVGLGYLNQTELTDEKFITNPFGDSKIYKTGDLVRYLPDGNIEYIGRIDHQVKLRGLRIELTEIECVLNQQSAVKECLVLVKNDVLVAYILTNKELDNHHLKSVLGHELPEYMIPQSLVTMDTWPLTPNGKIDRKALPEPNTSGQANYVAPTTEIEMILAQQWSQLLVLPKVGVQHNFFDLGGHSLLATQAISQIRDHFEIELPLRVLFEAPTIAELAAKIEITLRQGTGTPVPAIKSIDRTQDLPLSFAQERLWFIDQFQPNSIAYNIPGAVRIKGYINVSAMQSSLNDLIERHESLRTIFINQEGSAFQRVQAFKPIQIKQIQQPDNVDIAKDLIQRAKAEASLPFDLSVGPLLRVQLVQIDTEDHALFITMHHIVSDGWSMTLFIKEMAMLYDAYCKGHQPQLAPLPIQYGDYAFWQREWLQGDVLDQQLSYWKQELCEVGNLNLPTDRPRPAQQTMAGSTIEFNVDEKLARELRQFSQQNSSTLFMTLISVYQILLMRYSQQTDFAIGTPIAGRNRGETEQLIGLFVNTLAMKSQCHDDPDFKTLLERVREHSLDAYAHQDLPFERIVDALKLPRNVSQSPVFQVMFTLQTDQNNTQQGGTQDIQLQAIEMESHVSKFDISLTLTDHDNDKLSAVFEYNIDLFDKTTIETMIVHFNNLLSAVLENPETSINELPMLTKNECQQLLVDWNQTQQDFDLNISLQDCILNQVNSTPDAIAVSYYDEFISFKQLDEKSAKLASYLVNNGVKPDQLVGLCVERSIEMVVGLYAILKAGAAYLPIDPGYPKDRIEYMIEDANIAILLTQSSVKDELSLSMDGLLCLDSDWQTLIEPCEGITNQSVTADNLAYVIYTSGSTGKPKGVMIPHRCIVNHMRWMLSQFPLTTDDKILQKTPFSFDASVWEFFAPLMSGAELVMAKPNGHQDPNYLLDVIQQKQITTLQAVPSLLGMLISTTENDVAYSQHLSSLQRLFCGGEVLNIDLKQKVDSMSAELINLYGPTECTIDATYHVIEKELEIHRIPIGRAIANMQTYILDAKQNPVPLGVAGELYLAGSGVGRGYLYRKELTQDTFVELSLNDKSLWQAENLPTTLRLYKTGDKVRYLADGTIDYVERIDHQVKLRGYRIELGEIESALTRLDDITHSAVLVREDNPGIKRLVGYVVSSNKEAFDSTVVRQSLKSALPDYMVPTAYVILDEMPLSPSGKIDRKALPAPDGDSHGLESQFVEAGTDKEKRLAKIWQDVLKINRIGIHDNFFELGGDSILSIQVIARANQVGLALTPRQLFENQTIAELAQVAGTKQVVEAEQGIVTGDFPLTPIMQNFLQRDYANPHHWNQSIFLEVHKAIDEDLLRQAIQHILRQHDVLRMRLLENQTATVLEEEINEVINFIDLSNIAEDEHKAAIEEQTINAQKSLHIQNGPLLRVVYMNLGENTSDRLFIVAHHLVIDGVSWRVLLEDMQLIFALLQQDKAIVLPPKTTSFKAWAKRLEDYSQADEFTRQKEYWLERAQQTVSAIPRDFDLTENNESSAQVVNVELSKELTEILLKEVHETYHTRINDVLLTALFMAYSQWTNDTNMRISLEGHGREDLFEGVDISRTMGWFTSLFPLTLSQSESYQATMSSVSEEAKSLAVGDLLKSVKEQLRELPFNGVGYGILRYLGKNEDDLAILEQQLDPEISFNYLGQFDASVPQTDDFGPAKESAGAPHDESCQRGQLIDINGGIANKTLRMGFAYSDNIHKVETIEKFANHYIDALKIIISHCQLEDVGGYTPSDFALINISQQQVDDWLGVRRDIEDIYPLSPMQQGMLFHCLVAPGTGIYIEQMGCVFEGDINLKAFEGAWQKVIDRHSILRTGFEWDKSADPVQVVYRQPCITLAEEDWRDIDESVQKQKMNNWLLQQKQQGFDLQKAPLMTITLIRLTDERWQFVWLHHHLLMDGWSMPILLQEVFACYETLSLNQALQLPPARGFRDYIAWIAKQDNHKAEEFWKKALKGFSSPTPFFVDTLPKQQKQTGQGQKVFHVTERITQRLGELGKQNKLTLNTLVQGAWGILLNRYSGEDDVLFGAVVSGRPAELPGVDTMVGIFINTLPVRICFNEDESLLECLNELQANQADQRQYEYTPLAKIQQWSDVEAGQALFESILVFENFPVEQVLEQQNKGSLKVVDVMSSEQTNFPMTLIVSPGEQLTLEILYSKERFEDHVIDRLFGHFEKILARMIETMAQPVLNIPLLTDLEYQTIMMDWNATDVQYNPPEKLQAFFEQKVVQSPDNIALIFEGETLSYQQFNEKANQLAHYLIHQGVQSGDKVGVFALRSIEMVLSLYAIIKAGGAYLPLDPTYPSDRLNYMIQDANVPYVLTHQSALDKMPEHQAKQLVIDTQWTDIETMPVTNPDLIIDPKQLAYIIYTSGSTGNPKGTMLPHQAIINRLIWMQEFYKLDENDKVLQKTPYSFDVSVWEFFWPLMTGATLVIARPEGHKDPDYLVSSIQQHGITTLHFVPSMLGLFLDARDVEKCTSLKRVICSGEALPVDYSKRFFERSNAELHNLYGPTEAAVDVTYWQCQKDDDLPSVPIGKAITNTQIYILDKALNPMPVGVPGELHIGGVQLARGYLNRLDLTDEKFIPDPFYKHYHSGENAVVQDIPKLYKTGDLCRFMEDGNVEYIGRIDFQVKLRGLRIELGEIETAISQLNNIKDVAVLVREDSPGDQRLVAYLVSKDGEVLDNQSIIKQLGTHLPEFMVPQIYLAMDEFPLSPNGKLDRKALPKPDAMMDQQTYVEAETELQKQLVEIWEQLFEHRPIGIQDNFFSLGGHSLMAVRMMGLIQQKLDREIPLSTLLGGATIELLAQAIEKQGDASSFSLVVPMQAQGSKTPLFCVHAVGGYSLAYMDLAKAISTEQPFYAIESLGLREGQRAQINVIEMASTYIEQIKATQAEGPYRLMGHSFGGLVAYEMTRQLLEQGEQVSHLTLIDTLTPDYQLQDGKPEKINYQEINKPLQQAMSQDLPISEEDFNVMSLDEQIETILDLFRQMPTDIDIKIIEQVLDVNRKNLTAGQTYQLHALSQAVPVKLYRAKQRPEKLNQIDAGWKRVLNDDLTVVEVDGDHLTMLDEKNVGQWIDDV